MGLWMWGVFRLGRGREVGLTTSLGLLLDAEWWWLQWIVACPSDKEPIFDESDSMRLVPLTVTAKKGAYASHTSCPPSTTARPKAPSKDVPLLYGSLVAGEGTVKPVAGSQCTGPSTAHKGNFQVASVACLVPKWDLSLLWLVEQSIQAGRFAECWQSVE